MSGISTTISRKDLEFMAGDIGRELVPFLQPEDVVKGMDKEKQIRLFNSSFEELLKNIGLEGLLAEVDPERRQQIFDLLLKMQASSTAGNKEKR